MKNLNPTKTKFVAALSVATVGFAPMVASAQSTSDIQHRQQQKNQWRNLGYAGGAVGLYGLLKGDRNLAIGGLAGGAYSAWRYEQDRKSQSKMKRQRAEIFSHQYISHGGHRYVRHTVWQNGKKYYKFVRA